MESKKSAPEQTCLFLETETTGLDLNLDRVVKISAKLYDLGSFNLLKEHEIWVNPFLEVPSLEMTREASEKSGITKEDVFKKSLKTFSEVADEVRRLFFRKDGTPHLLCGFCIDFDLKMLSNEFLIAGKFVNFKKFKIIDIYKLHFLIFKNDLKSLYKRYTKKEPIGSKIDMQLGIFKKQLEILGGLGNICDVFEEQNETGSNIEFLDLENKLYYNKETGKLYFAFGKYKDVSVDFVAENDFQYIEWLLRKERQNSKDFEYILKKYLNKIQERQA